jgi:hypothetical protein
MNRADTQYLRTYSGTVLPPGWILWKDVDLALRFGSNLKRIREDSYIELLKEIDSDHDWSGWKGDCFEWTGFKTKSGYGQFRLKVSEGKWLTIKSHRVAFMFANGRWPDYRLLIRHKCGNRACCNPLHLVEGTSLENYEDRTKHHKWRWKNQYGLG